MHLDIFFSLIVLREDDNSEKANPYIDAAIGKREPIEKVISSIHLIHTYIVLRYTIGAQTNLFAFGGQ